MSVELCICNEFDTSYEREALHRFVNNMGVRFGDTDTLCLILANYVIGGRQVDLTVLKKDAIVVIELKECKDPFKAYENKDWITDRGHKIGSNGLNPFNQIRQYRIRWFELLKENRDRFRCLRTAQNDRPFWYVKGFVAVSPSLHNDTVNKISKDSWWFRLCGLNELDRIIGFETNKWMNFSDDELRFIATELLSLKKPKNITPSAEIHKLEEQLRQSADGLLRILQTKDEKIVELEEAAELLNKKIQEQDELILQLRQNKEQMNSEIQEKDKLLIQFRQDNEGSDKEAHQISIEIQNYKDKIHKLEVAARQQEEIIQKKANAQFHFVTKHMLFSDNTLNNKQKTSRLMKLSQKLGIGRNQAIHIIKQTIQKGKTNT
ncbi:nuclease-related domain-containing protein [Desulfonema magnum]|uniref:Nuclease-related NERD domain-containing protein n=1 Tax=Desulfonema magnum TaxID=45655 RepID=A0A975BMG1_9BACT|nr:nuclease-related domain-containing protein [Desulfonema magnum]QTA88193.1 Nuclease-related NERD domain-containing protein [Desulfonema magnum]